MELRRLIDYLNDPVVFAEWFERLMRQTDSSLRDADPDVVRLTRMGEMDESILLRRLVNGQRWLTLEHEKWVIDSPDAANDEAFQKGLDGWVAIEAQLRQQHGFMRCIHGEGQHCPADSVVICNTCMERDE
jgi:hypothetical protein